MQSHLRADIAAYSELSKNIPLEALSFRKTMKLMARFIDKILLTDKASTELQFNNTTIMACRNWMNEAHKFAAQKITASVLEKSRLQAWEQYDNSEGGNKNLVRVVLCCLYDEQTAEFDQYGAEAILETFLSSLFDLQEGLCGCLVEDIIRRKNKKQKN